MPKQAGVFVLKDDLLVPMQPSAFSAELDFQELLARFPTLLVGDQIDPDNPRRFLLVKREQTIGHEADPSRWSIDHLFLDQGGIPTLVEVKRQSDTRIRREVVGQMLDYAANCQTFWTTENLRTSFETTCLSNERDSDAVLSDFLQEQSPESFWSSVKTNLLAGRMRLLFVADQIPTELRRIVEFLNVQMDPAEVLAIELRQFTGEGLRTLVPVVYGQTQEAERKRASAPGSRWTEERFLQTIHERFSAAEATAACTVFTMMKGCGVPLVYGTGRANGSVYPALKPNGVPINPAYLSTEGRVWLQFAPLIGKPIFNDIAKRAEMRALFARVAVSNLADADLNGYARLSFATIAADPHGAELVADAFQWIINQVKSSG